MKNNRGQETRRGYYKLINQPEALRVVVRRLERVPLDSYLAPAPTIDS